MNNKTKMLIPISLIFLMLLSWGCEESITTEIDKDIVVVEGFLYEGQSVRDISLSEVLPLGSIDTLAPPITNAQVTISNEAIRLHLFQMNLEKDFIMIRRIILLLVLEMNIP